MGDYGPGYNGELDGDDGGNGGIGVNGTLTVNSGSAYIQGGNGAIGVNGTLTVNNGLAYIEGGCGTSGGKGGGNTNNHPSEGSIGNDGNMGQAVTDTITATTVKESDDDSNWSAISSGNSSTKQYVKAETHDFTYKTSGDTITAACSNEGCLLPGKKATLTIKSPTLTTYGQTGEGISAEATLSGLDDFKAAIGQTITKDSIRYYKVTKNGDSYAKDGKPLASAPSNAGDYLAEITLSGVKTSDGDNQSVTASVGYTIAPKPVTATVTAIGRDYEEGNTSVLLTAGTVNDILTGDTVTVDVSDATGTMADDKAGANKSVTASGVKLAGKDAGNYTLSEQPSGVKVTINKATAVITTSPKAKEMIHETETLETMVVMGSHVDFPYDRDRVARRLVALLAG